MHHPQKSYKKIIFIAVVAGLAFGAFLASRQTSSRHTQVSELAKKVSESLGKIEEMPERNLLIKQRTGRKHRTASEKTKTSKIISPKKKNTNRPYSVKQAAQSAKSGITNNSQLAEFKRTWLPEKLNQNFTAVKKSNNCQETRCQYDDKRPNGFLMAGIAMNLNEGFTVQNMNGQLERGDGIYQPYNGLQ